MIPDSLAPGIVLWAPDKTSARESGDEASLQEVGAALSCMLYETVSLLYYFLGWAYDAYGSYNSIFVLSVVLSILAFLFMFVDFYLKRQSVEEEEGNKDTQESQQTQYVITSMESSV